MTKRQQAGKRLLTAIDAALTARGRVEWTNGYRVSLSAQKGSQPQEQELYDREMKLWEVVAAAQSELAKALGAYTRAVRADAKESA